VQLTVIEMIPQAVNRPSTANYSNTLSSE